MTSLLATRAARRRGIAFVVLLAITLLLMAFSSNPLVRDVQGGIGFAFRPIQGALDGLAGGHRLGRRRRRRDRPAAGRQRVAARGERPPHQRGRAQRRDPPRERAADRAAPAPERLRPRDRGGRGHRPRVVRVPARHHHRQGQRRRHRGRRRRHRRRRRAGRTGRVGRAERGQRRPPHRPVVDGHRPARVDAPGPARSWASSAACWSWARSTRPSRSTSASRSSPPASSSAAASARRTPRACSSARSSTSGATPTASSRRPTSQPAANLDRLEFVLVITDYEGGLPPLSEQPIDCAPTARRRPRARTRPRCPRASSPASSRRRSRPRRRPARRAPRRRPRRSRRPSCTLRRLRSTRVKGIVLAGGTATRLFPLTIVTNKHLLPIYDRPMIYYPIETLASMGIREVMVIVGGKSVGDVVELLADGQHFGLDLTYRYQRGALGHRPCHRPGPRLRRRRRVLLRPRRQHPARPGPARHRAGLRDERRRRGHAALPRPGPGAVRGRRARRRRPGHRLRGEAGRSPRAT